MSKLITKQKIETVSENMSELLDIDKNIVPIEKQSKSKGGRRPGSGRKAGSTNKISGSSIIAALQNATGKSYEEQLAENYMSCIVTEDRAMVAKYDQMFLGKVVADKQEMDVTSMGEKLKANFAFVPVELPDWKNDKR